MSKHFLNGAFSGFTKSAVNDSSNYNAAFTKKFRYNFNKNATV